MALLHEARNTTPSHRIPAENLTWWRSWDLNAGLNEKNIYQNLILFWCANWKIAKFEYEIFLLLLLIFWFFDFCFLYWHNAEKLQHSKAYSSFFSQFNKLWNLLIFIAYKFSQFLWRYQQTRK